MYFVDRTEIEKILRYIEDNVNIMKGQESWNGKIERLALERVIHLLIESILDVGNALIDGFIMRDPGSYEDIIDILVDEKVISAEDEKPLKDVVQFRKPLVQNYLEIDHDKIFQVTNASIDTLEAFSAKVRQYLQNELGSITTFKP